jgi:hypothetical protein
MLRRFLPYKASTIPTHTPDPRKLTTGITGAGIRINNLLTAPPGYRAAGTEGYSGGLAPSRNGIGITHPAHGQRNIDRC